MTTPLSHPRPRGDAADRSQPRTGTVVPLRLLLSSLVIVAHSPEVLDGNRLREPLTRLCGTLSLGDLAVDGFFLLSGYLIARSFDRSDSVLGYLRNRVLRIYPGFIVASFASLALAVALFPRLQEAWGVPQVARVLARMVLLLPPTLPGAFADLPVPLLNASLWTIAWEFACYLLIIPIGSLAARHRGPVLAAAVALLVAGCILDMVLRQQAGGLRVGEQMTVTSWIRFPALFCTGSLFYAYRHRVTFGPGRAALAALGLCVLLPVPALAEAAVAVLGGYVIVFVAFHVRAPRALTTLESWDVSYGLYLYAWPVQQLLARSDPTLAPAALTAFALAASLGLGLASWVLVERPFLRLKARRASGSHGAPGLAAGVGV
ncbi:acyltransferase family protein [Methylobacterium sp. JK268]